MFRLVFWLVADVAGLDSASWNKQMVDGEYICAEENLDIAVSETLSGIWRKQNKNTKQLIITVNMYNSRNLHNKLLNIPNNYCK